MSTFPNYQPKLDIVCDFPIHKIVDTDNPIDKPKLSANLQR